MTITSKTTAISVNGIKIDLIEGLTDDHFGNAVRCYCHALTHYHRTQMAMFKEDYEFWAARLINVYGAPVNQVQSIENILLS